MTTMSMTETDFWNPRCALLVAAVLLLQFGAASHAQYRPGDLVVGPGFLRAGGYRLFRVTPSRTVHTITAPVFSKFRGMMVSPDNRSIWAAGDLSLGAPGIYSLAADGSFSTVALLSVVLVGVDGHGGAYALNPSAVYSISASGVVTTILAPPLHGGGSAGIDEFTGDIIQSHGPVTTRLAMTGKPVLTSLLVSTNGPYLVSPLANEPQTDLLLSSGGPLGSHTNLVALQIRPAAGLAMVIKSPSGMDIWSIDADPATRTALLASGNSGPHKFQIDALDLTSFHSLGVLWQGGFSSQAYAIHVIRAHSRHVCSISPAFRGTTYSALISFPAEANTAYVVGVSLSMRPGLHLDARRIVNLGLDPLLVWSLSNSGIFSGCAGVLDSKGEAVARVAIRRSSSLSNLRFFVAAATIRNGRVGTVSAPIGVTIQ